jgi:hypothetical protein
MVRLLPRGPTRFSRQITAALDGIRLIGSSLARALRRDSPGTRIITCARCAGSRRDRHPALPYAEIGRRIGPALKEGAILTDVGSVKQAVIRDLGPPCAAGGPLCSVPSGRRDRALRTRARFRRALCRPLVHPDPVARDRIGSRDRRRNESHFPG